VEGLCKKSPLLIEEVMVFVENIPQSEKKFLG
jgi:hypothetical protein